MCGVLKNGRRFWFWKGERKTGLDAGSTRVLRCRVFLWLPGGASAGVVRPALGQDACGAAPSRGWTDRGSLRGRAPVSAREGRLALSLREDVRPNGSRL